MIVFNIIEKTDQLYVLACFRHLDAYFVLFCIILLKNVKTIKS